MDNYVPRLKKVYKDEIAPALTKEFNYTTPMQVPAIKKIVVSMGVKWLNDYNELVFRTLSPRLPGDIASWLRQKTLPV